MNKFLKILLTFCCLSFVFSGLFGCGYSTTTGEANVNNAEETKTSTSKNDEGYPAPPATIENAEFKLVDGGTFNLKASKGKVILINLWATWCGPCRKEMPELVKMQDKYRDKGFEIIGLDTDPESPEEIKEFAEKMNLNYKLGWAESEMVNEFFKLAQMNGIPQSFLINREGKLTGMFRGGGSTVVEKMKETVEKIVND